jgi:3-oxoacyl-[acyl-carrier protein] reductase
MNQLDMKGRHAVVTGGASGLGFAIAQRLLHSGARVTIWDHNQQSVDKSVSELRHQWPNGIIDSVQVNLTNHAQVVDAVKKTVALADVDALVNSAGINGLNKKSWDYPVDDWQKVFDINVNGLFYCCRELLPNMIARNKGRIVNIASVAGKEGNPNASAYSASKGAVIALTKSIGKELADTAICINCVTPAAVKTPIFDQQSPEHNLYLLSKIPMGRFGTPDEIAAMVTWLCTEDCSFSTGAVFDLSGGRSTY